jgi:anti-anti-sigma factor
MEIYTKTEEKWRVIGLNGSFDAQTSPKAEAAINTEIEDGHKFIGIDLEMVLFMSSGGLRVLLSSKKKLKELGGDLVLIKPRENVMSVLEVSGFAKMFSVMDSLEGLVKV